MGTPYWMAPEVIGDQPYGTRADVWSAGVVLRELLQRRPPYFDLPVFRAMYLIRTQVLALLREDIVSLLRKISLDLLDVCLVLPSPDSRL